MSHLHGAVGTDDVNNERPIESIEIYDTEK